MQAGEYETEISLNFVRKIAHLLLVGILAFPTSAQISDVSTPVMFELANGMDVVVIPDNRVPVVTHMVWYRVGAADEAENKSGIAHLFEHVMFKATDDLEDGEFGDTVSRLGGQSNAFTSWDYTAYFQRVASEHLPLMMEMEAERMTDLIIDDDPDGSFITERDVVKEERRQRIENNPSALLSEAALSQFWLGHPYEITIIGRMDEVAALSPQDGLDFYRRYYSPENAILVVAGDVTPDDVRVLAERYYEPIQPSGLVDGQRRWRPVAPLQESVTIEHRDSKVRQPVWYRYYNGTSLVQNRDFALALEVGLQVLGGGATSLLFQSLVEENNLALAVGSYGYDFLHDEGPTILYATPSPGVELEALETAVMSEVERILDAGFDDAHVARIRNRLAADAIYKRDSQYSMARDIGGWVAIDGGLQTFLNYPDDVRAVTAERALAAVRAIFTDDAHFITARLLPDEER